MRLDTSRTAVPGAKAAVPAGTGGWLGALARLFTIPAEYREEIVSREGALEMLRCGDGVLDALIAAGLPCGGPAGAELFDRYDLFNLSLASGSGASVPERSIEFALRWMNGEPDSWFQPLEWRFSVELECPRPEGCGDDPVWRLAMPRPEEFGGEVLMLETSPDDAERGPDWITARGSTGLGVRGRLRTRGRPGTLRSPVIRRIVEDFMAAGRRWARMPEALQCEDERVLAHGVAPCISASLHLERLFRAAGFESVTRRGWILGMLDLAHAWVEVVDEDGVRKPIDPIFVLLSGYARSPHPRFAETCRGSRLNRLLPTGLPAGSLLAYHGCGGDEHVPTRRTVIRRAAGAPTS
ncbi:hypothetical protein [Actinomadura rudentiformis]|uniref:Uncharacterized protein n=1 Tax=Actinomadura rudentiformis TaxID=359158 RepID=A0A6H9YDV8_9ACTN|nr:hypothetical protein [Actinomadura rudentiformis]KAB2342448.1 hypothetical protein F8566_38540 [Actinomadura rudentiformis]